MKLPNTFNKRHPDDEYVDKVTIETVPRYKTSGLSGDEWRVSSLIKFWRKGIVVFERGFRDIETASKALPWFLATWYEDVGYTNGAGWQENKCFQPGCSEIATITYRLKQEWSERGEGPLPQSSCEMRRSFCSRHAVRGDCGLEDSDSNYIKVDGGEPRPMDSDEKSSAFGGIIEIKEP